MSFKKEHPTMKAFMAAPTHTKKFQIMKTHFETLKEHYEIAKTKYEASKPIYKAFRAQLYEEYNCYFDMFPHYFTAYSKEHPVTSCYYDPPLIQWARGNESLLEDMDAMILVYMDGESAWKQSLIEQHLRYIFGERLRTLKRTRVFKDEILQRAVSGQCQ